MATLRKFAHSYALTSVWLFCAACSASSSKPSPDTDHPTIAPYLRLGTALAADDADIAHREAKALLDASTNSKAPSADSVTAHREELLSNDIAQLRVAYGAISDAVIAEVAAAPTLQEHNIRVHCPMAFDSHGASWMQADGKVANPYFGAAMLRCGTKVGWSEPIAEPGK